MQHTAALDTPRRTRGKADVLPFDPPSHAIVRDRRRIRQAPWLLLPVLAILTGIGVSYVGEHATATQNSYTLGNLMQENSTLSDQSANLGSELQQLTATERIISLAEALGMKPAQSWNYAVVPSSATTQAEQLLNAAKGSKG